MLGYISIGCYNLRERALFSEAQLAQKLIGITIAAAEEAGVSIAGVLASNVLPERIAAMFPPRLHVRDGERDWCEIKRLAQEKAIGDKSGGRCIVLRPGCGWMNKNRIYDFVAYVREHDAPYTVSLRKMTSFENPLWNLYVAPEEYYEDRAIWEPYYGPKLVQKAVSLSPEIRTLATAVRSQDLRDFYCYDGAMYACHPLLALNDEGQLVRPALFKTKESGSEPKGEYLFEKLNIFSVNGFSQMDVSMLSRLIDLFVDADVDSPQRHERRG